MSVLVSVRVRSYFKFRLLTFPCIENKAGVPDINLAFRPNDNRHLIVHESAGLEPGDAQGLRAIRDFISNRIDPSCAATERLHAIW